MRKGRIGRGISLAKSSWAVIRSHPSLMLFPVLGSIAGVLAAGLLFAPGIAVLVADEKLTWVLIRFGVLAAYGLTFVALFFSVGLAACANLALDGQEVSFGKGFAVARSRTGVIAGWALVQLTVGLILNLIQSLLSDQGGVAAIFGAVIQVIGRLAWAVASFFVIPILALEGLGPKAALKRSVATIKERWGEGVVGSAAIGIVTLPAIIIAIALIFGAASLSDSNAPVALAMIAVGVIVFAAAVIFSSSLTAVFRVALYRFAADGTVTGGFEQQQLESAFVAKKRR